MQAEYDAKCKQYLAGKLSHDAFYLWVADRAGLTMLPEFRSELVRASSHFNTLSQDQWRVIHAIISPQALAAGLKNWYMADTYSVMKSLTGRELRPKTMLEIAYSETPNRDYF